MIEGFKFEREGELLDVQCAFDFSFISRIVQENCLFWGNY